VTFPNRDGIAHHVYSFSRAKTFEIPLYRGVTPEPVVFDNPGVVPLGCNIHDWMLGYVVVVEAPRFAQLTAGDVRFEDVPPGTYQVSFWHPALGNGPWPSWEIEVGAEGQHIELALPEPALVADQPTPPTERFDESPDY
jgi:hypothetical protein